MTKAEIIKDLVGCEFHFTDYGTVGCSENGDLIGYGGVCKVEIDGKMVKANLYKLPKTWASSCYHSLMFYEWVGPDDTETQNTMWKNMLKEELEGLI